MITRKLHFSYLPKSARIRVQVCKLDEVQRTSKLLQSTDGPIAIEVHRPADGEKRLRWIAEAEHHFQTQLVMPWDVFEVVPLAVAVWEKLGRPGVGAMFFSRELCLLRKDGGAPSDFFASTPGWFARPTLAAGDEYLAEPPVTLD